MKLITFAADDGLHVGAIDDSGRQVVDLTEAAGHALPFTSMLNLIRAGRPALEQARALVESATAYRDLSSLDLCAPLPNPVRMRDCSLFIEHLQPAFRGLAKRQAAEADDPTAEYDRLVATGRFDMPEVFRDHVIYYNADHLSISGPDDEIVAPLETRRLDYELEFAAVIGTTDRDVDVADAHDAIFGYTIFNDWSCRDLQSTVMQSQLGPSRGKDFDGANTLGPCIVTADELADPYQLELTARVNGTEWSRGSSATMHHTFADAIAHFSKGRTIHAGEVIGTGTVLSGSPIEIGRELQDGDLVELEVSGIGILSNRIRLPY